MTDRRITRRKLLAGMLAAGPAAALMAACGGQPPAPTPAPTQQAPAAKPTVAPAAASPTVAPAAAAPTATPAVAAKASTKPSGEVIFWYPDQKNGEYIRDEFNKAQSDVKATWQLGEYDTNTKTMAVLAAGTPPSMSYLGRWQTTDLAVRNGIKALDDYIKTARTFKWENIWERLQKDSISWGKKWIIPYTTDTRALFYNKDIMKDAGLDPETPPKTWQDIETFSAKILKKDSAGRLDRVGFTPSFGNPPTMLMFYTMIWCMNSDFVTPDLQKVAFMEKGPAAMDYLKKLMDAQGGYENAVAFTKALTLGEGLDAFSAGKVGLAMNGNWALANYDKYAPKMNYGMVPGPVFPEFNINANYDGGGGLFFFKQGKNFDGAWALAEFMMEPTYYTKWSNQFNAMPARSDVGAEYAKLDKRREVFVATANTVRWIPICVGTLEMLTSIARMFDDVLYGRAPAAQALQTAADAVQQILDKHNSFPVPAG